MICAFIAEHRARFEVAPICRVLSEHGCRIAPRTFYAWLGREPSKRALWDMTVTEVLAGYYEPDEHGRRKPESLYGAEPCSLTTHTPTQNPSGSLLDIGERGRCPI